MKNLIKILFLILLTTFNLSNWAIGGITNSGQAKPPVNRYAIKPIHPVTKVNPDFYRRPRPAGLMTPDNGQKGLPFRHLDWLNLILIQYLHRSSYTDRTSF